MKHRKSIQQFHVLNMKTIENSPKFDSPQELACWLSSKLGFPAPVVNKSVEFSKWLLANNLTETYRLRTSFTEENHTDFDEAFIDAQEEFLTLCDAWACESLMIETHCDLVAVWEGR